MVIWCFIQNNATKMSKYDVKVLFWPKVIRVFDRNDRFYRIMCLQKKIFEKKCKIKKKGLVLKKRKTHMHFLFSKKPFFFLNELLFKNFEQNLQKTRVLKIFNLFFLKSHLPICVLAPAKCWFLFINLFCLIHILVNNNIQNYKNSITINK